MEKTPFQTFIDLIDFDQNIVILEQKLNQEQQEIAELEDIAPFIVFNDATLAELARVQPVTSAQMLNISGIGDTKLARYGEPFLSLIKQHLV